MLMGFIVEGKGVFKTNKTLDYEISNSNIVPAQ